MKKIALALLVLLGVQVGLTATPAFAQGCCNESSNGGSGGSGGSGRGNGQ